MHPSFSKLREAQVNRLFSARRAVLVALAVVLAALVVGPLKVMPVESKEEREMLPAPGHWVLALVAFPMDDFSAYTLLTAHMITTFFLMED